MNVTPLAFESFGVRSMCMFIETDIKILVDPGTSLGAKRFGLPPWVTEFDALHETRSKLQEHARIADVVTVSHYHFDHFTPFSLGRFLDSSPRFAEEIYRDKRLFIKNPELNINKSQMKRAKDFLMDVKDVNRDITYSDGLSVDIGDTRLEFSDALPHGPGGSRLGFLVALTVKYKGECVMHASDVQGPIFDDTKDFILDVGPDMLILSGPPIYLLGFALSKEDINNAKRNLIELTQDIPKVVVDHHLLRDLRCFDFLESVRAETDNEVLVASEIIGEEPNLLEAHRKEFYLEK